MAICTLFLSQEAEERYPQVTQLEAAAQQTVRLEDALAKKIGDTQTPQGVFCICEKLDNSESAVKLERSGKYLILAGLQDPGNLGTILRTAQALGMDGVFLCGCPDLYAPKVLRAAMGGLFRLPTAICTDAQAVIGKLREAVIPVYAAALTEEAQPVFHRDFTGGCAVLIGNEGNGLPDQLIEASTGSVVIPMQKGANSLNASAAAAILIWEMARSRLEAGN